MKIISNYIKWCESIVLGNIHLKVANLSKNYIERYQIPICTQNRYNRRKFNC